MLGRAIAVLAMARAAAAAAGTAGPHPNWAVTWDMQKSTIIQPCNYVRKGRVFLYPTSCALTLRPHLNRATRAAWWSRFLSTHSMGLWILTCVRLAYRARLALQPYNIDPRVRRAQWSNAKADWVKPPMQCDLLLLQQCALLKGENPNLRCFVYRALQRPPLGAVAQGTPPMATPAPHPDPLLPRQGIWSRPCPGTPR